MAKAKRLLQSGQVTVLRNGFHYVVGHVIGDHGEYNCEFSRDDPNSRVITQWGCECPWSQFAFQRTRKWKHLDSRICSHGLALYWKSLGTPLDEQLTPEQAEMMGTGQAIGEGAGTPLKGPHAPPADLPRSFGPEGIEQGEQTQMNLPPEAIGHPPGPAQAPMAPPPGPQAPGIIPPFPGEQMEMPWQGPGTTPGGGVSPPGAISVPGAKPQSPMNPLQGPGTYSSAPTEPPNFRKGTKEKNCGGCKMFFEGKCWGYGNKKVKADDLCDSYAPEMSKTAGSAEFWLRILRNQYAEGIISLEEYERQVEQNLRYYDAMGRTIDWSQVHTSAEFNPPEIVRLKKPMYGIAEGPVQGQYGDGEYREVPAGETGEVLSQDASTGWVELIVALHDSGPHEPYHVRAFCEPGEIEHTTALPPGQFIRRRR